MNDQVLRFRVGMFILTMLGLLVAMLLFFGGSPRFFKSQNSYSVVFRDATGISPGTPVRRSGVRIGEVQSLRLDNESGLVHVTIIVERQFPLHKGDQATMVRGLLGGDAAIDFVKKPREGEPPDLTQMPPGSEFTAVDPASLQGLLAQTTDLVPGTQEVLKDVRRLLERLEKLSPTTEESLREFRDLAKDARTMMPELRRTNSDIQHIARQWTQLGERLNNVVMNNEERVTKALDNFNEASTRVSKTFNDENQRNFNESLKSLRSGSANLDTLSRNSDEFVKEGRESLKRFNDSMRRADEVLANLQQATKPWADRSAPLVKNLEDAGQGLALLVNDVRQLLRLAVQGEGTLKALLNDPSLYNNLNDAACMITRILPRLDRIMRDVELFADKIARHPESLGLGGVVHPGSGLKK